MREEGKQRTSKWDQDPNEKPRSSLEAAAEAAAKVNAMLIAKGKLKPSQISVNQTSKEKVTAAVSANTMVVAEVDINDVPVVCRNLLTRGVTQDDISKTSGAAVSTRGRYMTPEERMSALPTDRPLYLYVHGPNQESVDKAVGRITDIIRNTCKQTNAAFDINSVRPLEPQTLDARPHISTPALPLPAQPTGLAFVQEKLFIGLEHAPPSFDVKNKILGPHGSYLHHIQMETGAKVMLRGKGSDFIEPMSGREAFEPMHIYIQHSTLLGLQQAKQLALNLIQTVQQDYAQFQQALAAMPPTISPGTATLLAGLQQQSQLGLTLVGTSMSSPLSVIPVSASPLGQPALSLAIAPTVGLTSLSPGQTVLLDTSVPPPPTPAVAHFQPSCTEPQTIALSVMPTSVSSIVVDTSIPPPNFSCLEAPAVHPLVPIRPQLPTGNYVLPAANETHMPDQIVLQPGMAIPPPGSNVSQNFSANAMISQTGVTQPALVQPMGAPPPQLTAVLPQTQSVIQLHQLPQVQIVVPGGQPATHVLNPGLPPSLPRPTEHHELITKNLPSSVADTVAYVSPFPVSTVQTYYSQYVPSTVSPVSSTAAPATSSSLASTEQNSHPRESSKRRFKEEKESDKVPDNLLGYQHGPLHISSSVLDSGLMQSGRAHSAATVATSALSHTSTSTRSVSSRRREDRPGNDVFAVPPPPPPSSSSSSHSSKAIESKKRSFSSDSEGSEKKKLKGALVAVAASKEDTESEGRPPSDQQSTLSSLHYNHYASKPMMYGEDNVQQQQPYGSSQPSVTIGMSNSIVASSGLATGVSLPGASVQPASLTSYAYQIQQPHSSALQYGQFYGRTMSTPPLLPQHTVFIHETPVSLHQYAQQQQSASLGTPTIVQHPTVYIQDSQVALPAFAQHPVSAVPLQQSTTTLFVQDIAKQPPPGFPPPLSSVPGQHPVYVQEAIQHQSTNVQHPPPPPPGSGHQQAVILQETSHHPPSFLAPPPVGQQSTIYIHESAIGSRSVLPPQQSPAIQQQTIYLQETGSAVPCPQTYAQPVTPTLAAIQGPSTPQSTIIIHETTMPPAQFVASCPPPNMSAPLPSLQLQHPPPQFVSQQQPQGSQSVYGQLAYASDYNTFSTYVAQPNAVPPPASTEEISHVNETSYWMPCS